MRRLLLIGAVLAALSGCGDDDGDEASTAPRTQPEPVATVPGPDTSMPKRCSLESLGGSGPVSLAVEGGDCDEAVRVLLEWLETKSVDGYECARDGKRVECTRGETRVEFTAT